MQMIEILTYGTLKSGFRANMKLEGSEFLGIGTTSDRFKIFGSAFPMAFFDKDGHKIRGEVYRISKDTLKALDQYEGYPTFYDRKEIIAVVNSGEWSQIKKVWMYYIRDEDREVYANQPELSPGEDKILEWK